MSESKHLLKERVVTILSESFRNIPGVLNVIKQDGNNDMRLRSLARYAFNTAYSRDGVYMSTDGEGAAICYRYNYKKNGIRDYLNQLVLGFEVIGFSRIFKIIKRDNYIKSIRKAEGDYLYFWFLGVSDKGRATGNGAVLNLKDQIFAKAEEEKLPVYLETSVELNKRVYQRYGFEVYHEWQEENNMIWFMRKHF